jgi:hypothetical protein
VTPFLRSIQDIFNPLEIQRLVILLSYISASDHGPCVVDHVTNLVGAYIGVLKILLDLLRSGLEGVLLVDQVGRPLVGLDGLEVGVISEAVWCVSFVPHNEVSSVS